MSGCNIKTEPRVWAELWGAACPWQAEQGNPRWLWSFPSTLRRAPCPALSPLAAAAAGDGAELTN